MPRAPKQCGRPGCDTRVVGRTYCDPCQSAVDRREAARRPSTSARGYDTAHKRTRADWAPIVAQGIVDCWRCGERITKDEAWHLGHDDHDRTITRGPEHARRCNLSAAGRLKAQHNRDRQAGTGT